MLKQFFKLFLWNKNVKEKKHQVLSRINHKLLQWQEIGRNERKICITIQCNLDLVTLNSVTTCYLVTIFQRQFFKDNFSIYCTISFHIVTLCDLVKVFAETKSVTKSRLHPATKNHWKFSNIHLPNYKPLELFIL